MNGSVYDRLSCLAEPLRVRILRLLEREELAVGELSRVLQSPQPTVSRHLKQLDEGGWVQRRRAGTAAYFRLAELGEAAHLWAVVRDAIDDEEPTAYADDLRRLDRVLASRAGDSEALFRRLGGQWDAVRHDLFGEAFVLPALLSMLPPGLVVADLGCGTGGTLPLLAPVAARVIGIDREEAMLEVAAARAEGLANVELRRGQLDALPLPDAAIDVALCQLVLHHVAELAPVFAELRRVLRPGGRAVLLDMVEHDREDYRATMGHRHLGFSRSTLCALARGAGLSLGSYRELPVDPAALGPGLFVGVVTGVATQAR